MPVAITGSGAWSTLGTPDQVFAEGFALAMLADPEVQAAMDAATVPWRDDPMAARPLGRDRLEMAVRQWTSGLAMMEAAGDPMRPRFVWTGDTTPRTWFGHTVGGSALANDNPDTVYREAFVDGSARYEIVGRRPPNGAGFVIEPLPEEAGVIPVSGTRTGPPGSTAGAGPITDADLRYDADGNFRILVGGAPEPGVDHIATPATSVAINLRDVLWDWSLAPVSATIRRLSPPPRPPLGEDVLRARVLAHLPAYVRHYAGFKDRYRGGIAANAYVGPLGRAGAWSYILSGRFALAPGRALVVTAHPCGAAYQGLHVADMWAVGFDNRRHQASLNTNQALPDADGAFTYVIAAQDPGVANWIDTAGCLDGFVMMRWMRIGPDFDPDRVVRRFEVIDLAAVGELGLAAVDAPERAQRLADRRDAYGRRCIA